MKASLLRLSGAARLNTHFPFPVFTDHKRRKLDSHSSPSHSSSVKVSMAWGRLCPFLLYLPERSLPLHIPAAPKITKESCRTCTCMTSGKPYRIHGSWKAFHGHQHNILQNWEKPLKDLAKKLLYILSIFILKYLSIFILMKAVSVPWEERNFLSISIFRVDFFAFWE